MLDLRFVRENPELVKAGLARRGITLDLAEFLALDKKRRASQQEIETLRRKRNEVSEEIGRLKKAGQRAEDKVAEMRAVGDTIAALEASGREVEEAQRNILLTIPNLPHASVPDGKDENDNQRSGDGPLRAGIRRPSPLSRQAPLGPGRISRYHRF